MHEGTWTVRPCPHRLQTELARALGISELTAGVLVRRGYSDPEDARAFLDGRAAPHDPFLLGDMRAPASGSARPSPTGRRICVHGDYDVDGISATALAVLLLRELGADVEWHLPSRFDEGYGVSSVDARAGSPARAAGSCSPSTAASRPSRRSPRRRRAGSR